MDGSNSPPWVLRHRRMRSATRASLSLSFNTAACAPAFSCIAEICTGSAWCDPRERGREATNWSGGSFQCIGRRTTLDGSSYKSFAKALRQASSDASSFVRPSPTASRRRPSSGWKLFGNCKMQRHNEVADHASFFWNVLQFVTASTKGPPYFWGRVLAWLFKTKCHFTPVW